MSMLQRSGIAFPQRSANAPPIFTPPTQSELTSAYPQSGYGVPSITSVGFDAAMTSDMGNLRCVFGRKYFRATSDTDSLVLYCLLFSFSDFRHIRDALELLREMLQAVNPNDCGVGVSFFLNVLGLNFNCCSYNGVQES